MAGEVRLIFDPDGRPVLVPVWPSRRSEVEVAPPCLLDDELDEDGGLLAFLDDGELDGQPLCMSVAEEVYGGRRSMLLDGDVHRDDTLPPSTEVILPSPHRPSKRRFTHEFSREEKGKQRALAAVELGSRMSLFLRARGRSPRFSPAPVERCSRAETVEIGFQGGGGRCWPPVSMDLLPVGSHAPMTGESAIMVEPCSHDDRRRETRVVELRSHVGGLPHSRGTAGRMVDRGRTDGHNGAAMSWAGDTRGRVVEMWMVRPDKAQTNAGVGGSRLDEVCIDMDVTRLDEVAGRMPREKLVTEDVSVGDRMGADGCADFAQSVGPNGDSFVGPNGDSFAQLVTGGVLGVLMDLADPLVLCEVGQDWAQHDGKRIMLVDKRGEEVMAHIIAQQKSSGALVGLASGPDLVLEADFDFGYPQIKASRHPPVGFKWMFTSKPWALFPIIGLGLCGGDGPTKISSDDVGEEILSMVKDSQEDDLNSDDPVSKFQQNILELLPSLQVKFDSMRQKPLKGTRKRERPKNSSTKWTEDADFVEEPSKSAKKQIARASSGDVAADNSKKLVNSILSLRCSLEFLQQHEVVLVDDARAEEAVGQAMG